MGLPVSLILIAIGAVLAFAVHQHPGASVDVHVVGWVLLAVGLVGVLLSLFLWERLGPGYWGWGREPAAYGGPSGGYGRRGWGYRGRRTVVEEEGPASPAGPADPYDAPPPP
jgi:hypothetical protein